MPNTPPYEIYAPSARVPTGSDEFMSTMMQPGRRCARIARTTSRTTRPLGRLVTISVVFPKSRVVAAAAALACA